MKIRHIFTTLLLLSVQVLSAQIPRLTICKGMTINYFSIITSGNAVAWNWTFPGGVPGNSIMQNPTNISYPTAGLFRTIVVTRFDTGNDTTQYIDVDVIDGDITSIPIGSDTTICGNINLVLNAGNPGASYIWNPGNSTARTLTVNAPGTYGVSVITRAGQWTCDSQYREIVIRQSQPPVVNLGPDRFICNDNPITLDAGGDGIAYLWSPGGEITRTLVVGSSGNYSVRVTNADGCVGQDGINVKDSCPLLIWIPNVFTPNTDQLNDVFHWKGNFKARVYNFKIYNRWGEKLFETDDPEKGWDGKVNGNFVQEGVYIYTISAIDTNNERRSYKGEFTLIY
jgi:gliding motility-associated-like protein